MSASHQIVREWRTMIRERSDWEKYRLRIMRQYKELEKATTKLNEDKAKLEADMKAEEWGRERLKAKLRAAEDELAKEKAEFKRICEKDNQRYYAARSKIVELEGKVVELTVKVEDAQVVKDQVEVELAEVKARLSSKDKDLLAKDVDIAELKRRLRDRWIRASL